MDSPRSLREIEMKGANKITGENNGIQIKNKNNRMG